MTAENHDFKFERACNFRARSKDVLSAHKELYDRKVCEAKQSSILLYFKPSTSDTAGDEPQPLASRQAYTEDGADVSDLSVLMDSDDNEMLTDYSFPFSQSPVPPTTPTSDNSA